ncbi:hypothetical protein MTO96_010718 [Rhipicephalus appendiculatus]
MVKLTDSLNLVMLSNASLPHSTTPVTTVRRLPTAHSPFSTRDTHVQKQWRQKLLPVPKRSWNLLLSTENHVAPETKPAAVAQDSTPETKPEEPAAKPGRNRAGGFQYHRVREGLGIFWQDRVAGGGATERQARKSTGGTRRARASEIRRCRQPTVACRGS